MAEPKKKIAVVTGANKGIGFEICRQLACEEIRVILTSRDEKRGLEAIDTLKESTPPDSVFFHPLDVTDSATAVSLAEFVDSMFGKLDILVNNAGISGVSIDTDAVKAHGFVPDTNWKLAAECIETNYYGAKRTTEALLPLLQLSDSPRIVNVSSTYGKLKHIPSEGITGVLKDAENLTEERIEEALSEFLKDFKEGFLETKGWIVQLSPYIVSKAAVNAYTRILAKKYPKFRVNSVCPGFVKTDINGNSGVLSAEEGAESPVRLALLPDDGPSGLFFDRKEVISFED